MTTVVIDFKNKKVVADKQATGTKIEHNLLMGSSKVMEHTFLPLITSKIHKLKDEDRDIVFVAAGDCAEINRQLSYIKYTGYIDKPKDNCTIAIVYDKGDGLLVDTYRSKETLFGYKWQKSIVQGDDQTITFGSGGDYAYGAIMGGLSAEEAVVAASKCDIYTSNDYDVVKIGGLDYDKQNTL